MTKNWLGVISVSAALLAAPLAASAADMGVPYTKAPPPPPVMSWTGCYVDGGWGYGCLESGSLHDVSCGHFRNHDRWRPWLDG